MPDDALTARVVAVQDDIVTIQSVATEDRQAVLKKNEVIYICPTRNETQRQEKLKAEVLRIRGTTADAQVFESTAGVAVGDPVEQTGALLSVSLGPGLLGQVFDGLQNPLQTIATEFGVFLPRGVDAQALDPNQKWSFVPRVRIGSRVYGGDTVGTVQEGRFCHKIMAPFDQIAAQEVTWVQEGNVTIHEPVLRIRNSRGAETALTLMQQWPVRRPLPNHLLNARRTQRLYPDEPMVTTLRLIDTFFPIARGGTGCIPGPFGAGKTVLQNLISRYSSVDIVVVVACGERAGEIVETITEFPKLNDPKSTGSLMDRTVIIANTSSMPVAAREASIYTGITLGEYYRQMGFDVLLIADSTSRWAQAMRETSGRLEEIPGEEAFPAYLDSSIRGIYERAGVMQTNDGSIGSLTMIGTVSPAGGNFEEPVTQSTLATVKTFLGLSADRAYKRFFPAVDPLTSWSRYPAQMRDWYRTRLEPDWMRKVESLLELLRQGESVRQMMQVTGEEGVSLEDYLLFQKSVFVDMVYLQQDAFDPVDASVPLERQQLSFNKVYDLVSREYRFADKNQVREYFTRLTGLLKNFNYSAAESREYFDWQDRIDSLVASLDQTGHPN